MPLPGILGGLIGGLSTGNLGGLGMGAGSGLPTVQPTAPAPAAGNPMDRIGEVFKSGPMGQLGNVMQNTMGRIAPSGSTLGSLGSTFNGAFRRSPFGFRR